MDSLQTGKQGGIIYGWHLFKEDGDNTVRFIKMDITGSVLDIEAGVLDSKTAPAAVCTGCKRRISSAGRYGRQTLRGYK